MRSCGIADAVLRDANSVELAEPISSAAHRGSISLLASNKGRRVPCRGAGASTMQTDCYTYRVTLSGEDGEHIGPCAEFLSLSWLAKTRDW